MCQFGLIVTNRLSKTVIRDHFVTKRLTVVTDWFIILVVRNHFVHVWAVTERI